MPFIPKARDLQQTLTGGTIRLAARDTFERRSAVRPPSATGGAPKQKPSAPGVITTPEFGTPLARPIPAELQPPGPFDHPADKARNPAEGDFWRNRDREPAAPMLPFLLRSRHAIEDYSTMNEGLVTELASAFATRAEADTGWAARMETVGGPQELAARAVAQIQRAFELESEGLDLPSQIYASRNARQVRRILDNIRGQRGQR